MLADARGVGQHSTDAVQMRTTEKVIFWVYKNVAVDVHKDKS